MTSYADFLVSKQRRQLGCGIDADNVRLPDTLYVWQSAIVHWALKKGRLGRRFHGFELKPEYAVVAEKNLRAATAARLQGSLFAAEATTA